MLKVKFLERHEYILENRTGENAFKKGEKTEINAHRAILLENMGIVEITGKKPAKKTPDPYKGGKSPKTSFEKRVQKKTTKKAKK